MSERPSRVYPGDSLTVCFVPDSVTQQLCPHTVKPVLEPGVCPLVHVGMFGKWVYVKMGAKIPTCFVVWFEQNRQVQTTEHGPVHGSYFKTKTNGTKTLVALRNSQEV